MGDGGEGGGGEGSAKKEGGKQKERGLEKWSRPSGLHSCVMGIV